MAQITVIQETGVDEAGNKHPAPGIADGEHQCELKWESNLTSDANEDWHIWVLAEQPDDGTTIICGDNCGCKYKGQCELAEQEKEVKTAEEQQEMIRELNKAGNDAFFSTGYRPNDDYKAFMMGWNARDRHANFAPTSSTRIAELEARVAELEGVLEYTYKTANEALIIIKNKKK